jgi:hypothetical protein
MREFVKAEIKSDLAEHYGVVELEYDIIHNQWRKRHTLPPILSNIAGLFLPRSRYSGEMKNGKPDGFGEFFFSESLFKKSTAYIGFWKNGRFHGEGRWELLANSYTETYIGQFKDGLKHGLGYDTGRLYGGEYRGRYENDVMLGEPTNH